MTTYFVIDCENRDWKRFSSNSAARDYIEEQLNDTAQTLYDFMVLKCDNGDFLNLSENKRITISIGDY